MDKNKAIFLDRDGVINKEIGYLHKIEDFEFIEGVFEACNYFQATGYLLIIITNQSGIGRGYYTEKDFHILSNWMIKQFKNNGIIIFDIFFCPHLPENKCSCRKPNPKLLLNACIKHNIDIAQSWIIGDKETDIKAGNLAGIKNTILVKTGHEIDESKTNAKYTLKSIKDSIPLID